MRRDVSKRYASLFSKVIINPIPFLYTVYSTGKIREFVSFIIWEMFHQTKLFPQKKYLTFHNNEVLTLDNEKLTDLKFTVKIKQFFKNRELNVTRSEHKWRLIFTDNNGDIFGTLHPNDRELYKSVDNGKSITLIKKFPERIKSIFISSDGIFFVSIEGSVYKSSDSGITFTKSLKLGSSISYFRHNNAMTELPNKTLIIGEYGNVWENNRWRKIAYLYFSVNNGETWEKSDFLIKKGANKHVHIVKYSKLLNKIFVADGDNKKKLWISDLINSSDSKDPKWNLVNRFHIQLGGYTSILENDKKILFGTDYQGGTNFIVDTRDGKSYNKKIVPDPYRRSPIDNMVKRKSKSGDEIWANLSFSTARTKCLLMYSADDGESWNKVLEYGGSTHLVKLISSSVKSTDNLYFSIKDIKNDERVIFKVW